MANKGPSPEEQLLNLIEKGESPKGQKAKKKKPLFPSFASLGRLLPFANRINLAVKRINNRVIKNFRLEVVNKSLVVLCILIFCYSVFDFIFNKKDIEKFYRNLSGLRYEHSEEKDTVKLRPFLHYLAIVQRRDIFSPVKMVSDVDIFKERKETLQSLVGELSLVGISWGAEPQAMIENTKTEQTFFLKAGDEISGMKIEEIQKNKVILSYEGEEEELI